MKTSASRLQSSDEPQPRPESGVPEVAALPSKSTHQPMKHTIASLVTTLCAVLAGVTMHVNAEVLRGVPLSQASQAASREYALCVKTNATANYIRLRKTMFAGAWAAGQAAVIASGLCKARWEAYESSTAADFRVAGAPIQEVAPGLRNGIDALAADQLLETEAEPVPLCKVQQTINGINTNKVPRLAASQPKP